MAKIIRELILKFYERFEAKKALNENILERILRGKKRIMRAGQVEIPGNVLILKKSNESGKECVPLRHLFQHRDGGITAESCSLEDCKQPGGKNHNHYC